MNNDRSFGLMKLKLNIHFTDIHVQVYFILPNKDFDHKNDKTKNRTKNKKPIICFRAYNNNPYLWNC